MKRPNLNMLRTFEVAARHMSFSLAGSELNISQAAVSQQIRKLEAYLGAALFLRGHRALTLTPTGTAYQAAVAQALDRLDNVTDQLFPDRPGQTVTIGCTSSIATLWLAPRVGAFHLENPGTELRIRTLDSERGDGLAPGTDIAIHVACGGACAPGAEPLLVSAITPVAAPGLLQRWPGPRQPAGILGFELIHVTGYADDWHKWFRTYAPEVGSVPRGLTVDGSLIALEAAMHGDGVALGRRPFIDQYLQSGQLAEVFGAGHCLAAQYCLRQPPVRTPRKSVGRVRDWLIRLAGET